MEALGIMRESYDLEVYDFPRRNRRWRGGEHMCALSGVILERLSA